MRWATRRTVKLDAEQTPEGAYLLNTLVIDSNAAALNGKGAVDIEANTIDMAFDWSAKDVEALNEVIAPAKVSAVKGSATAVGQLTAPKVDVNAVVQDLEASFGAIDAIELRIDSAPEGAGTDSASGIQGFSFVAKADGMALTDTALQQALGPDPTLTGKGAFYGNEQRIALESLTVEAETVDLKGNAEYDIEAASLDAELSGAASKIGPFARVAGLPVNGIANLALKIQNLTAESVERLFLNAQLSELSTDDPNYAALLGDSAVLEVLLVESDPGIVKIDRGFLESATLRADAAGTLSIPNDTVDLKLDWRFSDASRLAPIIAPAKLEGAEGSARVTGTLSEPKADIEATVTDVAYEGIRAAKAETTISAQIRKDRRIPYSIASDLTGFVADDPTLAALAGDAPSFVASGIYDEATSLLTIGDLKAETAAGAFGFAGDVNLAKQTLAVTYSLKSKDLDTIGDAAGVELGGSVDAEGAINGSFAAPIVSTRADVRDLRYKEYAVDTLDLDITTETAKDGATPFKLDLTATNPKLGDPGLDALVGANPTVKAQGSYNPDGPRVALETFEAALASINATAAGKVDVAGQTLDLEYDLDARELDGLSALLGIDISGAIKAKGRASGSFIAPEIDSSLDAQSLQYGDYSVGSIKGKVDVKQSATGYAPFDIDVVASDVSLGDPALNDLIGAEATIKAKGEYNQSAKALRLEAAEFDTAAVDGTASGSVDLSAQTLDLTYDIDAENLAPFGALLDTEMTGAVSAKGTASGSFTAPELDTTITGRKLRYDKYRVGSIDGKIQIAQSATGFAPFVIDVVASKLSLGDPALNDLVGDRAVIKANGSFNQSDKAIRLESAKFETASASGSASGSVNLTNQTIDLAYDVNASSLAPFGKIAGVDLAGAVSAKGKASGTFTAPVLDTTIEGRKLRYGAYSVGAIDGKIDVKQSATGFAPFAIDITASDVDLGDPALTGLIGEKATVTAKGDFNQSQQRLRLDGLTVNSAIAKATASGSVDLAAQKMDIDFALDAASLAGLEPLVGQPISGAIRASGNASGTFTEPSLTSTVDGRDIRYAQYAVGKIDGRVSAGMVKSGFSPFDVDLTASGIDLGDPALNSATGGAARMVAKGGFDIGGQILRLDRAHAETAAATTDASGTVNFRARTLDMAFDADANALAPFSVIAGTDLAGALKASGRATGPFTSPAVNATLSGGGLRYGAYSVGAIDGKIDIPRSSGGFAPFEIDVTASGISLGDPALDALIGPTAALAARGQIDQAAQIVRLDSAQLSTNALNASASGEIDLGGQTLNVGFSLDVSDLSPATAIVGKPIRGTLKASGSLRGPFAAPLVNAKATGSGLTYDRFSVGALNLDLDMRGEPGGIAPFTLSASAFQPRIGDPGIDSLLGETLTLNAVGTLDQGSKRIRIDDATARAAVGGARIVGNIDLGNQTLDLGYAALLPTLGMLQPVVNKPLGGSAFVDGRITGAFADPSTSGILTGNGIFFDTYQLGNLTARYDLMRLVSGPAGEASIDANTPQGPLTASVAFDLTGGVPRIDRLSVNGLGLNVDGNFRSVPGGLYEGEAMLNASDLAPLGALIGQEIAGTADGTVRMSAQSGLQYAVVDLKAANISYAQGGAVIATVASVDIRGQVADAFGADPTIDGSVNATQAVVMGFPIQQVQGSAQGPLSGLNTSISGSGGETGSERIDMVARLRLVGFPRGADVSSLSASYKGVNLAAAGPFRLTEVQGGGWRAEGLDLRLDDGEIVGSGEYTPNGVLANLRFRNVPLQLAQLSGFDLIRTGRLEGQVNIDTRTAPRGDFSLTATVLRLKGAQLDDPFDFVVTGTMDGSALNAEAKMTSGLIQTPFVASARIPLNSVAGQPLPLPDYNAPFTAQVDWNGDVSEFWAFVPAPDHVLSGPIVLRGRAGGTLNAPQLEGGAVLTGGRYQHLDFGTLLDQLNARADFTQDGRVVFEVTATDGVTGTLRANGSYIVADGTIDSALSLNQAALVRRDDLTAVISGDATAKSIGRDLAVAGAFRTDFVELRLIGGYGSSLVVVDAIPVGETAPLYTPPSDAKEAQRISLDVSLDFPQQVFVRGRGLESEWGGQIKATGYASAPRLTGIIEKRRGWLDLLGRQFELSIGDVRFSGPLDPFIRVRLQRDANDITGWLDVTGPASDLEIGFGSIPALPPDEVLPRLLFGRSKQSLSGLEAAQLAAGVATLLSGKASALDSVRGALGVDVLRVEGGDEEGTSVSTGKYISQGVFVGAKQNLTTGQSSAIVEIEVFENIEIEAELGAEEQKASGSWKLDY